MNTVSGADLQSRDEPKDGFGNGYFDYQARIAFRDLRRLHGFEVARQIMAQIINDEADKKRITIDG